MILKDFSNDQKILNQDIGSVLIKVTEPLRKTGSEGPSRPVINM